MSSITQTPLGAPGIYRARPAITRVLDPARMDICAFAGVAPRGPVRHPVFNEKWRDDRPCVESARPRRRTLPVVVESFDEYRARFGGFEGPGLLPYAVGAFFANGGRRAWIARIVHDYGSAALNNARVAEGVLGAAGLRARSEGSWGNQVRAGLTYTTRPVAALAIDTTGLTIDAGQPLVPGALVRLTFADGTYALHFIVSVERTAADRSTRRALFDSPAAAVALRVELVEGELNANDGGAVTEKHDRLGFSPEHPRWLATVLCYESDLLWPQESWIHTAQWPASASLTSPAEVRLSGGLDDYAAIVPDDFFDDGWVLGDDEPGDGVHAFTHLDEVTQVLAPDLYSPGPLTPWASVLDPVSLAGPEFARCVVPLPPGEQQPAPAELEGLRLDPSLPSDRAAIIALQSRLVTLADQLRRFIVLLDVPPGLDQRTILAWRASFDSSYAAAYHPWVQVARGDDQRDALIAVPPSSFAAGTIAQTEALFGVPHGPANRILKAAVDVTDPVSPARHDQLHPVGVNVLLQTRDGVLLSAARTLSSDVSYRQLSVRRLMLMLRKTLDREMQWAVFEPNDSGLRSEISHLLRGLLRRLFAQGAFRGAKEEEAFFVRCDDALNPRAHLDLGRLVAEIGVAPAEPLEFIVIRLERTFEGGLRIEE